jgi:hypothetical protein
MNETEAGNEAPKSTEGIKEILEVLDGMAIIAKVAGKVLADSKVGLSDAKFALDLAREREKLMEAFKGIDGIRDEIRDLDTVESSEIAYKVYNLIKAFKEGKAEG